MYKLTLKCRVITPMFMAGADKRTPELRPSEFKGMMRWWWRAIKAEDDIKELKKNECEIFGGTGEGMGKSKIKITVRPERISYGDNVRDEIMNYEGLKYLYYSTFALKARGQPIIRRYISANTDFEISIFSFDREHFLSGCVSLWLAMYLGGFGTRARRGGGNIEITEVNGDETGSLNFKCDAENTSKLKDFLKKNLERIKEICEVKAHSAQVEYTNLKNSKILIFDPKNNWKEALNFLGEAYKNFRSRNKSQIFEVAAFGMPVMHSRFSVRMVPYMVPNKNGRLSDRWASPLIFKVIKTSYNLYFPVIIKLSAGGIKYIGKEKKEDGDWELENNNVKNFTENLINAFLNTLPKKEELVL